MAFSKTGISISKASIITPLNKQSSEENLTVGEEKDGKIWDGKEWILKKDWEKKGNG